ISRDLDKGMEIAPLGNCVTSDDRGRPTPGPPQEIVMSPLALERGLRNPADPTNERFLRRTESNVARYASQGPKAINRRLWVLDPEWDIERTLQAHAAVVVLIGVALGAFVSAWFLLLPALAAAFLWQHAVWGWCLVVPLFRRLGVRTQTEIDSEKYALKAL